MAFDPKILFDSIRKSPFGGRLGALQVRGVNAIVDGWRKRYPDLGDIRQLAYVLATAYHETGGRMYALREGFAITDAGARRIVAKAGYKYAKPDPQTGHVYYGRGLVQITWRANYETMARKLGLDLVNNPDLALSPPVAVDILITGMIDGDFTTKTLAKYFNAKTDNPRGARRIINGMDRADDIAVHHRAFLDALKRSMTPSPKQP